MGTSYIFVNAVFVKSICNVLSWFYVIFIVFVFLNDVHIFTFLNMYKYVRNSHLCKDARIMSIIESSKFLIIA
jgi:hypothetical protein